MLGLQTPLRQLPRMQAPMANKFAELGLVTLRDALLYFPFRHEDWRKRSSIADVSFGQEVTIHGKIIKLTSRRAWHRRGTTIVEAMVADDSGAKLKVVWFNLPFLAKSLNVGDALFLSGTIVANKSHGLQLNNPLFEKASAAEPLHEKLVPVYRSTEGLSQRQIRLVMKQAVALATVIPDPLPADTVKTLGLVALPEALRDIHFPPTPEAGHRAVERLKWDELLSWHLQLRVGVEQAIVRDAPAIPFRELEVRDFVQHLPFTLTDDQRLAAWQILQDMTAPKPMSRLVQGDVGSGKTVVAALVAYNAALSQVQTALLAPTVVLAQQHYQTLQRLLDGRPVSIALMTGHATAIDGQPTDRQTVATRLASGETHILVGTHALLQPDVRLARLGLVIVDEQQRFGVEQRQALLDNRSASVHYLSLTATPIPRSFALWLTGILAVSSIKTKPKNRLPITTTVFGPTDRAKIDRVMTSTVKQGHQVYVITPLIDESDTLGVRAATTEHHRLTRLFPPHRVGLVHGGLPAVERVAALENFRQKKFDLLVSTTVIEVGVDVPNATLMVIEGAERFGLAQLHQLRGRVGRSDIPSQCFLVTDRDDDAIRRRLDQVARTTDGFAIAELDLRERGGGDLYGQRQSGLPSWQLASLTDVDLFRRVKQFADSLRPEQHQDLLRQLGDSGASPAPFHPE